MLAIICVGCSTLRVKPEHKERIERYRREGKLSEAHAEIGYTVNMFATMGWAFLPGANQIHICRKIVQSPYAVKFVQDYPEVKRKMCRKAYFSLAFSWIPSVYGVSMPLQMSTSSVVDVHRVNNLAYMYHIDEKEELNRKNKDSSTIKE